MMMKEIKIVNVLGEEILKQVQNDKNATIDVSGLAKGIYFVEVYFDSSTSSPQGQVLRRKFVKN
jgi:Secretion system C-terminal sorting domain